MKRFGTLSSSLLTIAAASLSGRQASAQVTSPVPATVSDGTAHPDPADQVTTIPDIVVTAQKRSESAQKVPIAIVAATDAQLQNAGVANVQQLNTVVPGINVRNNAGGSTIFIRGVGTSASLVENPVAAYVDDVYIPNQRTVGFDLIDVTQVTVLKGPQGTLFGRNATGGVVQLTTRDPTDRLQASARVGIDNYATFRSAAFVGGPLTEAIKGSLSGSFVTQGKGWGHDDFADYDTFRIDHKYNVRGKFLFAFSPDAKLKLSADFQETRNTNGLNEVAYPGTQLRFEPNVVGGGNYYDSRGNNPAFQILREGGASATLDVDTSFAHLRSISAYRRGFFTFQFDADRTPTTAQNINLSEPFNSQSEEIQIISPTGDSKLTWVLGAFYFRYKDGDNPIDVQLRGPIAPAPASLADNITYGNQTAISYAGFGQATFEFLPNTRLTAGLRYTTETRHYIGVNQGILNNGTFIPNLVPAVDASVGANNWSWRVSLDRQLTPNVLAYVSYDRGFKSGGFNASAVTNPPYSPERLDSIAGGIKSELFGRRLRLNFSAFHYDYKNLQVVYYTIVPIVGNGANAEMYGLDADFEARLTPAFSLTGGLSLLHAKFTEYKTATFSIPQPNYSVVLVPGDAKGNQVPFAQPVQFNIAANYRVKVGRGSVLFTATESYNSKYYFEADNRLSQPAYNYVNLSATWALPDDRYSVRVWATNLLNEHVATTAATQTLGYIINYGNPPRLFGITFDAKL